MATISEGQSAAMSETYKERIAFFNLARSVFLGLTLSAALFQTISAHTAPAPLRHGQCGPSNAADRNRHLSRIAPRDCVAPVGKASSNFKKLHPLLLRELPRSSSTIRLIRSAPLECSPTGASRARLLYRNGRSPELPCVGTPGEVIRFPLHKNLTFLNVPYVWHDERVVLSNGRKYAVDLTAAVTPLGADLRSSSPMSVARPLKDGRGKRPQSGRTQSRADLSGGPSPKKRR
jgi:hypothetical protein